MLIYLRELIVLFRHHVFWPALVVKSIFLFLPKLKNEVLQSFLR
jgi:hypothetical protein